MNAWLKAESYINHCCFVLCLNKVVYEKHVSMNLTKYVGGGRDGCKGIAEIIKYRVLLLFKFFILAMFLNACNID